jgi:predicted heme/steroid binding protein
MKKLTNSQIAQLNRKNGSLAYVGYKDKIYDVTGSYQLAEGENIGDT